MPTDIAAERGQEQNEKRVFLLRIDAVSKSVVDRHGQYRARSKVGEKIVDAKRYLYHTFIYPFMNHENEIWRMQPSASLEWVSMKS